MSVKNRGDENKVSKVDLFNQIDNLQIVEWNFGKCPMYSLINRFEEKVYITY